MLDQAFDALKTYDWGADRKVLQPIDEAVIAKNADAAARKDLETRLAAVLKAGVSRDAMDYVCRKLMLIGTAASVPTLAELLGDKNMSHMARYALERIPAPEAATALREAVGKLSGALKIGVICSLGHRRDTDSVAVLAGLLGDADQGVARAAGLALGSIRSADAAKALNEAKPSEGLKGSVTDARLACAEALLAEGKKAEALGIYKSLTGEAEPKQVRLAATRGMLACAGKKN